MTWTLVRTVAEAGPFRSVRKRVHPCYALYVHRARSLRPPERRGILQPRATPWEYSHHGSQALKGRNKAADSAPKSGTQPACGKGLSPLQGSLCINLYSQDVALGYIIAAFQAGHPRISWMRVRCGGDGRTPIESTSAVVSARNASSRSAAAQSYGYRTTELADCCWKARALPVSGLRESR